ncbi:MAG: tetratricopeptide (TPR) repeat protein [Bacteroidia bacterium]|jgi:tetratricopeptide (TPR) repeat protein
MNENLKFDNELNQALGYLRNNQPQQAAAIYQNILARDPNQYDANYSLGMMYRSHGRNDLAIELILKSVEIRPDIIESALSLGMIQHEEGLLEDAQTSLNKVVAAEPGNVIAHSTLGLILTDRGELDMAFESFQNAMRLEPDHPISHARMGMLEQARGNKQAAFECLSKSIELAPDNVNAHRSLAFLQKQTEYNDNIRWMEAEFESAALPDYEQLLLGYALGKVFDDLKQYDKSFGFLQKAHYLQNKLFGFSIEQQSAEFAAFKTEFNHSFLKLCEDFTVDDSSPVFVLGMPRSGTSLVEQILASHPLAFGAGEVEYMHYFDRAVEGVTGQSFPLNAGTVSPELIREVSQAYIKKLRFNAGSAEKVIDKLPSNYLRVGLIAAAMPHAKIILCERDPLDLCTSIYQNLFGREHTYAWNLSTLGDYYSLYQDLMDWWEELVPGRMYRLSYEKLITDTENEVRKLLDHCELPFHENCLAFHKTNRRVKTPSEQQVRQPIFQSSIGRWKNYQQHLGPLIESLERGSRKNGRSDIGSE